MSTTTKLLNTIALLCLLAVGIALVSQHVFGMQPCAWCVLQRLVFLVTAAVCLVGNLFSRVAVLQKIGALLALLLCLAGIMAAWYQYNVAQHMFSCDLTFADRFMVQTGLDANLPWLFGIFATCMDARVSVLGIEYVLWSLSLFILLSVASLVALWPRAKVA